MSSDPDWQSPQEHLEEVPPKSMRRRWKEFQEKRKSKKEHRAELEEKEKERWRREHEDNQSKSDWWP